MEIERFKSTTNINLKMVMTLDCAFDQVIFVIVQHGIYIRQIIYVIFYTGMPLAAKSSFKISMTSATGTCLPSSLESDVMTVSLCPQGIIKSKPLRLLQMLRAMPCMLTPLRRSKPMEPSFLSDVNSPGAFSLNMHDRE